MARLVCAGGSAVRLRCAVWAVVVAAAAVPAAHGQLVPGFYVLEGTRGVALSADGTVAGGTYESPTADFASRWTLGPGTSITRQDVQLPTPPLFTSGVQGFSADGSTLVGRLVYDIETVRPFRIGADGVVQNLGTIGSYQHVESRAVNGDGSVVVGYATQPETFLQGRSWRWTQATGMQYLPNPSGGIDATVASITPDGSVIAGYAFTNTTKAMVWRNGVPEFLGTVPGTAFGTSYAWSVSDDGNVVVGRSDVPASNGPQAVRWVGNEPYELVTSIMASSSVASAVNGDGSLIGGSMNVRFQPPRGKRHFSGHSKRARSLQVSTSPSGAF